MKKLIAVVMMLLAAAVVVAQVPDVTRANLGAEGVQAPPHIMFPFANPPMFNDDL